MCRQLLCSNWIQYFDVDRVFFCNRLRRSLLQFHVIRYGYTTRCQRPRTNCKHLHMTLLTWARRSNGSLTEKSIECCSNVGLNHTCHLCDRRIWKMNVCSFALCKKRFLFWHLGHWMPVVRCISPAKRCAGHVARGCFRACAPGRHCQGHCKGDFCSHGRFAVPAFFSDRRYRPIWRASPGRARCQQSGSRSHLVCVWEKSLSCIAVTVERRMLGIGAGPQEAMRRRSLRGNTFQKLQRICVAWNIIGGSLPHPKNAMKQVFFGCFFFSLLEEA